MKTMTKVVQYWGILGPTKMLVDWLLQLHGRFAADGRLSSSVVRRI
jgi:hypothetical protein